MKMFQPWNDAVRLLSGDWVLQPGRKPIVSDVRLTLELEQQMERLSLHRVVRSFIFMLVTLVVIL